MLSTSNEKNNTTTRFAIKFSIGIWFQITSIGPALITIMEELDDHVS